ncbi:MAG: molybdopterin-binding protein [Acidobacteriota bacterium]|nr:molybdopterin-binding protein [Blastocatellia bacterium]MDW8238705.1 molybdopterin-binding protein [Acidobacteriota bacterium]
MASTTNRIVAQYTKPTQDDEHRLPIHEQIGKISRVNQPTAVVILIGNELLSGRVEDANAKFLLPELYALGVAVKRVVVIPDDVDEIAETVRDCAGRFDYVFTSGGVGPTHDDLTIAGVARAFGRRVVHHEELKTLVASYFEGSLTPEQLRFAEVPEGAQLIYSEQSPWPVLHYENVYIFPGVPWILKSKFTAIRDHFRAVPFHSKTVFVNQDEVALAPMLSRLSEQFPAVAIGSYPTFPETDYRVKIVLESKDRELLERAFVALMNSLDAEMVVGVC